MYLDHFNLNEKPFQNDGDKRFFWLGDSVSNVALSLNNDILAGKDLILLSGESGTGKTMIVNWIADVLESQFVIAKIYDSYIDCLEFFNFLSNCFQLNKKFDSKSTFLLHFRNFLIKTHSSKKKLLLIFDNAHNLKFDLLNELVLLSEIRMNNQKLISILLAGQQEMLNIFKNEEINKLAKTVVNFNLDSLSEKETNEYIGHRLKIAGVQNEIFRKEALQEIFSFSKGNPRMINIICDHALITAFTSDKKIIESEIINECRKSIEHKNKIEKENSKLNMLLSKLNNLQLISYALKYFSTSRILVFSLTLLICIICIYFLYEYKTNSSPPWKIEEIAPRENDFQTLKQPISTITNNEKNRQIPKFKDDEKRFDSKHSQKKSSTLRDETESSKARDEKKTQKLSASHEAAVKIKKFAITPFDDQFVNKKTIIYFRHDSNELLNAAFELLDKIAEIMSHYPNKIIEIRGYTDSSGEYGYNLIISKYRADSVKSYLEAKGINPERMKSLGMGPHNPLYPNETREGRILNRRVEIEFLSGEQ